MGVVVVGLDSSETSHRAFREAIKQAEGRGGSVLAVHVVSMPVSTGYDYAGLMSDLSRVGEEVLEKEIKALESEYSGGFPVEVKTKMTTGHAGAQIIATANDAGDGPAEMVVLGSRGHGGFKGLLLGSVSTYAAHHLTCPLLVVPATDAES